MKNQAPEPVTAWGFLLRYPIRIICGAALLLVIMIAVRIDAAFRHEQSIADKIKSGGGQATVAPFMPKWVPKAIRGRYGFLVSVDFKEHAPSDDVWSDMGSLRALAFLNLMHPSISDPDVKRLKQLTHLRILNLSHTKVTDAGLEHLYEFKDLKFVGLSDTPTTSEGRASLRIALPNCKITPDP